MQYAVSHGVAIWYLPNLLVPVDILPVSGKDKYGAWKSVGQINSVLSCGFPDGAPAKAPGRVAPRPICARLGPAQVLYRPTHSRRYLY